MSENEPTQPGLPEHIVEIVNKVPVKYRKNFYRILASFHVKFSLAKRSNIDRQDAWQIIEHVGTYLPDINDVMMLLSHVGIKMNLVNIWTTAESLGKLFENIQEFKCQVEELTPSENGQPAPRSVPRVGPVQVSEVAPLSAWVSEKTSNIQGAIASKVAEFNSLLPYYKLPNELLEKYNKIENDELLAEGHIAIHPDGKCLKMNEDMKWINQWLFGRVPNGTKVKVYKKHYGLLIKAIK